MQISERGAGKPIFGKPHMNRQRQCVYECRCDLCGKPIKSATKVSLSHARSVAHSYHGGDVLQVEPLLHKHCAAICIDLCPSLKADIKNDRLNIFHVTKHDVQIAWLKPESLSDVGTNSPVPVLGHAKVWLQKYKRKPIKWLGVHQ